MKSPARGGGTDEPHGIPRGRVFLCTWFLVMLGLGVVYQQVTNVAGAKPLSNDQWLRPNILSKSKISSAGEVSSSTMNSTIKKSLTVGDPGERFKIKNAITEYCPSLDKKEVSSFTNIVQRESRKYGYDWELILAIIKVESAFNVQARSDKGATGLMQLMPETAEWLSDKLDLKYRGLSSLYDPKYNVRLGTHYLRMMHRKFGNLEKAIVAYNKGPANLMRHLAQGGKVHSEYLEKVMSYYKELKKSSDEMQA